MLLVLLVCLCKSFQRTLFISLAAPRQLKRASLRSTCTSFLFASRTLLNLVLLEVSFVLESGCKGITKSLTVQEFWRKSFKKLAFLAQNWPKSRQKHVFKRFCLDFSFYNLFLHKDPPIMASKQCNSATPYYIISYRNK